MPPCNEQRTETRMSIPLGFDGVSVKTYASTEGAGALPQTAQTELKITLPFRKATLRVLERFGDWARQAPF